MRTGQTIVVTLVIIVVAAVNEANALHCWICATSAIDGQFCRDPFKSTGLSEEIHQIAYKECPQATHGFKPVCKKLKQRINNVLEIKRGCFYRDSREVLPVPCANDPKPYEIITLSCETCDTDGCNGSISISPIHNVAIVMSAMVALIFKILHL